MIVYDYNDPFSTLWWMHGSVIPHVLWLSVLCALNGSIAVYFKESYNYYLDHTPHLYLGTTIGVLLVFKGLLGMCISDQFFDALFSVLWEVKFIREVAS